jgi:hypothetical protein
MRFFNNRLKMSPGRRRRQDSVIARCSFFHRMFPDFRRDVRPGQGSGDGPENRRIPGRRSHVAVTPIRASAEVLEVAGLIRQRSNTPRRRWPSGG